jgi:hypothetical protein
MRPISPRSVLILCDDDPTHAGNVLDHLEAFQRHSKHEISFFNPRVGDGGEMLDLEEFDVVVIHYTIAVKFETYLPAHLAAKIAAFRGLKIQFIQDEYRWVDEITAKMRELGIDVLYSCVPEAQVAAIYGGRLPGVDVLTTLAGYVPEGLAEYPAPALRDRPIDVGYRGRHVPYWLGRLGQEKVEIGRGFRRAPEARRLALDIAWSESDRIYGEDWIRFLSRCRTTLGTESGASIVDFTGEVERAVIEFLASQPAASFAEVEAAVLAPYEGNAVINVVSPRVFEAAALRTALVLFPGDYSGAVEPWRHYIPLEKDFSNIGAVIDAIRDDARLTELTDQAFRDLIASGRWSLARFVDQFDREVDARAPAPNRRPKGAFDRALSRQASAKASSHALRLRAYAKRGMARYAIAKSPESRRLRAAYRSSDRAKEIVSHQRFEQDLQRLAALIGVQQRRLDALRPFVVVPIVSDDRLVLVSRPPTAAALAEARRLAPEALKAIRQDVMPEIVWHHVPVDTAVCVRVLGELGIAIDVGYYGMDGVHHFSALERLGSEITDPLVEALRAAIVPVPDGSPRRKRLNASPLAVALSRTVIDPKTHRIRRIAARDVGAMPVVRRLRTFARRTGTE